MTCRRGFLFAGLCAVLMAVPAAAQPGDDAAGGARRPVAEQMRRLFAARLKADVGLDDAQVAAVLPRVESLEQERARSFAERRVALRELRRGLERGMSDAELQRRLDTLDRLGSDSERTTREALAAIDHELDVPQRVRFRFLMVRFRQEMTHRVQEFRHGAPGESGRHRGGRGVPPSDAPNP